MEKEKCILTKVDSVDWITILLISDGAGATIAIWAAEHRQDEGPESDSTEGDTPEHINKME